MGEFCYKYGLYGFIILEQFVLYNGEYKYVRIFCDFLCDFVGIWVFFNN